MVKIKFRKGNKVIAIYDGKKFIGLINTKEFMTYINDPALDIKEFFKE